MKNGEYMELLNCKSADEVYEKVRGWSSELSAHEHLVRSTILDIQASLEGLLKDVYYQILLTVLFQGEDEAENEKARDDLYKTITKMNFSAVFRVLRPILQAYPSSDLAPIQAINDLRNEVAHSKDIINAQYKGRNPFQDADTLAQVFLEAWAARDALRKFYQRMIEEPAAISAHYVNSYRANYDKVRAEEDES
ncbi:MAG: hypothetical protein L0287_23320 [Anaerolineae bacterium]|nr:hypothetical protein [Anaerolineae bacterium]MCI0609972.1 hypothetical protein [Anaerolineae bacterium]